jgi:hypothetical protein
MQLGDNELFIAKRGRFRGPYSLQFQRELSKNSCFQNVGLFFHGPFNLPRLLKLHSSVNPILSREMHGDCECAD